MAPKKVLAQTQKHSTTLNLESQNQELSAASFRMNNISSKKLTTHMVPGYTGYIPKSEKYFGRSSAIINHKAIYDLETEKWSQKENEKIINQTIQNSPMKKIRDSATPYTSQQSDGRPSTVSPYFAPVGNKNKNFITGYTGYIPQSRFKYSKVYKDQTKESLNDFTTTLQEQQNDKLKPLEYQNILIKKPTTAPASTSIYRANQGLLPKYTGYLPGHKYRYGVSIATSARLYKS